MHHGPYRIRRQNTLPHHRRRHLGDRQRAINAEGTDSSIFACHLQRRHAQPIAEGEGSAFDIGPAFTVLRQIAAALVADAKLGWPPQAKATVDRRQHGGRQRQRNVRYRDVARFLQHAGDGQFRPVADVFDQVTVHPIRRGVQHGIRPDQLMFQPHHHHHRFHRRTRFEAVAAAHVADIFRRRAAIVVRVERRIAGHTEDFAGVDLDQYRTAGVGLVSHHAVADLRIEHVLDKFVDAERHVRRRHRIHAF